MARLRTRRMRRVGTQQPEITLTPLIDTALTLLIIFMVTTPMIERNAIKIALPQGISQEGGKSSKELVVTIDKNEAIYCNNVPVSLDKLASTLKYHLANGKQQEQSVWVEVDTGDRSHDKSKSCSAKILINVVDCIKALGGVKDVKIALDKPRSARA